MSRVRAALALAAFATLGALAAPAHARGCHDSTRTVGRQHCRAFGWWAGGLDPWFEAGPAVLRFDPSASPDPAKRPMPTSYTPLTGAVRAVDYRLRGGYGFADNFYFLVELGIADLFAAPDYRATAGGGDNAGAVYGAGFVGGVYLGARVPVGPFVIGGDAGPGTVGVQYSSPDVHPSYFATEVRFTVDARVRADLFVTPNISAGIDAATDLVHLDGYLVGVTIGFHYHPYDRMR